MVDAEGDAGEDGEAQERYRCQMRSWSEGGRVRSARSKVRRACVCDRAEGHDGWTKRVRYESHRRGICARARGGRDRESQPGRRAARDGLEREGAKEGTHLGEEHEGPLVRRGERAPLVEAEDAVEGAVPLRLVVALAVLDLVDLALARLEPLGHGAPDALVAAALPRGAEFERVGGLAEDKEGAGAEVLCPEGVAARVVREGALVQVGEALEALAALLGREAVAEEHALDAVGEAAGVAEGVVGLVVDGLEVGLPALEAIWVAQEVVLGREVVDADEVRVRGEGRDGDGEREEGREVGVGDHGGVSGAARCRCAWSRGRQGGGVERTTARDEEESDGAETPLACASPVAG